MKRISRAFILGIVWLVNKIYRIKTIDKEKIIKEGPLLVAINHRHSFDALFVIFLFGKNKPTFVAKSDIKENFLSSFAAWAFDVILVKRDGSDFGPLKEMIKEIKSGNILALFPEGTRNGLHKGKFANGATYIALKTGVDIQPIGISGNMKMFGKNNKVKVGDKFNLLELMDQNKTTKDKDEVERLNEILKEKILVLTDDGFYDDLK